MNLYRIVVEHYSPKNSHRSTEGFVFANNEEEVYRFIDKKFNYNSWEEEWSDDWNDKQKESPEYYEGTYKEHIIKLKGEINDEDIELEDLYYGHTLYGWELADENTKLEYEDLKHLGIFHRV